jgi:hypothetical protein
MGAPVYSPSPYAPMLPDPALQKPTTAFALSLVAGILILLGGVLELWVATVLNGFLFINDYSNWLLLLGVIGLGLGIFVIALSVLLFLQPQHHVAYGVVILVLSVLSAVSYWGFVVGLVLGIIGGILAITWTPIRWAPTYYGPPFPAAWQPAPVQTMASSHRVCLKCGRLIGLDSRFCSYCGTPTGV